jgi:hypothetical protein
MTEHRCVISSYLKLVRTLLCERVATPSPPSVEIKSIQDDIVQWSACLHAEIESTIDDEPGAPPTRFSGDRGRLQGP